MPSVATKSEKAIKHHSHGQGSTVIDLGVVRLYIIISVCMSEMTFLSQIVQKLWSRLILIFCHRQTKTDRQTNRPKKLEPPPQFRSGGFKRQLNYSFNKKKEKFVRTKLNIQKDSY